jgi:hypothetical protein
MARSQCAIMTIENEDEEFLKFIQNQNFREMIDVEAKSLQSSTCQ